MNALIWVAIQNVASTILSFGIRGEQLLILLDGNAPIAIDLATAELQIELLPLAIVCDRGQHLRLDQHPVHKFTPCAPIPFSQLCAGPSRGVGRTLTFYSLPPGKALQFGYVLGRYFEKPSVYTVRWEGRISNRRNSRSEWFAASTEGYRHALTPFGSTERLGFICGLAGGNGTVSTIRYSAHWPLFFAMA